ncbi:hypothetical protein ACHAXN_001519 [Cyclotella atomus]
MTSFLSLIASVTLLIVNGDSFALPLTPTCLQDGKFLVKFYTSHPSDTRFNHINQRYWLHYHSATDIATPIDSAHLHLIRPSDSSEQFARTKGLVPLRLWINLTHDSTYIHGPFNFTTVCGRRSRDRVSEDDWRILLSHRSCYDNKPPELDLPTFSVHVDGGIHAAVQSPAACALLSAMSIHSQTNRDVLYR